MKRASVQSHGGYSVVLFVGNGQQVISREGRCCVLKGTKPVPGDEVQSKVVGYGWKSIATYEVQANGKLSQVDYYEDLIGAAPTHYWFASSRQLVKYYYVDVYPSVGFFRESWSYDATKGFILIGDEMLSIKERYQQVLRTTSAKRAPRRQNEVLHSRERHGRRQ